MGNQFWRDILLISVGAVIGANLRYAVSRLALIHLSASVPYGTLIVNVSGSLAIGAVLGWTSGRVVVDPAWRMFLVIGFCGAYTTFSSYGYETVKLLEQGDYMLAGANVLANNVLSLLAVVAGIALIRAL